MIEDKGMGKISDENIKLIDESKQNIIKEICFLVKDNEIVRRVIVFGSAANKQCNENSDIDICYDISCDTKDLRTYELSKTTGRACDYNCDIVYYSLLGDSLKKEVDTKGIVVYES